MDNLHAVVIWATQESSPNNIQDSPTANQENQTETAILIPPFKDASSSNLEMFSTGYTPNLEAVCNLLEL